MAADFTPLVQTLKAKLSGGAQSRGDTAFFTPVAPSLQRSGDTTITPAPAHVHGAVQVDVKREGDRISRIQVRCRCGELIDIECEY